MSRNPASLSATQESYEQRFNCIVCLCARLEMVSGMCQHRVCANCLYDERQSLRKSFQRCPVCHFHHTFPSSRPEIPEDNVEMMRCLGVRACPNQEKGCDMEMWEWEIEEHLQVCTRQSHSPRQAVHSSSSTHIERKDAPKDTRRPRTRSTSRLYNFRSHFQSK